MDLTSTPDAAASPRRLRLRAVGWSLAFLLGGSAAAVGLGFGAVVAAHAAGADVRGVPLQAAVQTAAMLAAFIPATWLVGVRVLHLSSGDLRYRPLEHAAAGVGRGLAIGALPAVAVLLLAVPLGGAGWIPDQGTAGQYVDSLSRTLLLLAPAAFAEEMIFRGVPMVILARAFSRPTAIVALAVGFGLMHTMNPHVSPLAVANVAVAGLFLGAMFFTRGGIWASFGAHLGWNFTLAALDAPVSGVPFRVPLLDYRIGGPAWLTGGAFGPEGGLLATAIVGLATVVAWRLAEPTGAEGRVRA